MWLNQECLLQLILNCAVLGMLMAKAGCLLPGSFICVCVWVGRGGVEEMINI